VDEQAHRHEPEPARDPEPASDTTPRSQPERGRDTTAASDSDVGHEQPMPGGEPAPVGQPGPAFPLVPPPPPEAWAQPVRIEPVAGTPYGLAILGAPSPTSGPAVGALVCGIASILVSLLVTCFGLLGAAEGWGIWVAGAFAVLAGCLGIAGIGLGIGGIRQTRDRRARVAPSPPYRTGPQTTGYPTAQHFPPYASGAYAAGTQPAGPASGDTARPRGRGMAVAGLACGIAGGAITACVLGLVAVIQFV
jgi:hypothetical protein